MTYATTIQNKELISAYMRRTGRTYITSDADDLTPLLPFLILDVEYQLYLKYILPLECAHESARWKKEWGRTYTALNNSFFSAFDDDQCEAVIDRMGSLEEYVSDSIEQTRAAASDYLSKFVPHDKINVVSVCMVCSVLAQSAGIIWDSIYRDASGRGIPHRGIDRLIHAISAFLNSWHKPSQYINCNDDPTVDSAVVALQARLVGWLRQSRGHEET